MSVRFIVGRAGSGKTHHCLESIRARLRESPVGGGKLLLLVPEQASFQMERALVETPDLPGFLRCEILSFQRLAQRIFAETGADPRRTDATIGPLGRMMVLRNLIRRERSALQLLHRVADKPGLVKQLAGTIEELMREDVAPDVLAGLVDGPESDPLQSAKLADVTRLYRAYLDYLLTDRLDPAQYLGLAAQRLPQCSWVADAEVWLDGFAGFTTQEYHLIACLAARAHSMEITLLLDPAAATLRSDELPLDTFSLFARTERTLVRLRRELSAVGVTFDPPLRLTETHFAAPELGSLERGIFGGPVATDAPAPAISVLEFTDRRSEVEAAVAEIQRLTLNTEPPLRYRDVAIIVRDLTAYHDLLSAALRTHDIPFFIDRRQPTTHHPLIELVRSLLAVAVDDCRLDSVRLTLKSGLLPIASEDADLLENYVLAGGIEGRQRWRQPWAHRRFFKHRGEDGTLNAAQAGVLERINAIRMQWLAAVGPWIGAVDGQQRDGRAWAVALFECLDGMGVAARLQDWAVVAEGDGRQDEADAHRQVWLDFVELLDEFVRALGTGVMGVREFRETIEAGLAEFTLGLAPPTLDQVLVGAIERSRHPNIRAALILGFDEAHFPMRRREDPLLGDSERQALETGGVEIGSSRRRQLLDERSLAYIALTRASERLWISSPRAESDGKPLQPSPYLTDVLAAVPGVKVTKVGDPRAGRETIALFSPAELGARLAAEFRTRPRLAEETDAATRSAWNTLYTLARGHEQWRQTLARSLAGLGYTNDARLPAGLMAKVIAAPFVASVSRLERFAACPFSHFVEYTLGLDERVEPELQDVDLGQLCHSILEKFVQALAEGGKSLATLEDDEIVERIDGVARELIPRMSAELMLDDARNAFLFDRSRGHLHRVTLWQRDAARAGKFLPQAVEWHFGYKAHRAPPLVLSTPGGRTVHLRGKIDRIDLATLGEELVGTIIDYKRTTRRRLDICDVYHGLALQLVGYLVALQQVGESLTGRPIRPVAAFYLPLLEPYQTVSHPSEEKKVRYQWRGIADASAMSALDGTLRPGGASQFISARLKADGEPHANCDLSRSGQVSGLMRHVTRRMGELADRILDGDIAAEPYRLRRQMPCGYCKYHAICRYEVENQPPARLNAMKKAEVFAQLATEVGDG
jgi:ATP-dependent helicase/nuclease subunit B